MNDVGELKEYVVVHANGQGIAPAIYRPLFRRIESDVDGADGSWAREWAKLGEAAESDGRLLEASRLYTMARFPYVDGPVRREAHQAAVRTFERWLAGRAGIERLDTELPSGAVVRSWAAGLSAGAPRPVLLVLGGIVSVKEQWAQVLLRANQLGLAVIATEMPGTGENTARYDADSWQMLSRVLDTVSARAKVTETYALAMSFSGHLALRCAITDNRIRGIVTAGMPVRRFFTDEDWQSRLPRVTVDTLAHLTGSKPEDVTGQLASWAISDAQLSLVDIPVRAIVSLRDEIVPMDDVHLLAEKLRDVEFLRHNDVHGSPAHVAESRLWSVAELLALRGGYVPQRLAVRAVLALLRLRGLVSGRRA